ncbi:immunoglobulin-like domain-containing protein [Paenibacillus sinopodophylli]|uniref:immunoglobulin-like domain-containing protein n=1 Tax=Paenibacillus sinopodophylli TaxID=1837342 RepID=UPI00110CF2D0|nr:immunoglobulin-like domain-containing protein [Paenibacillus sinopodophylli]
MLRKKLVMSALSFSIIFSSFNLPQSSASIAHGEPATMVEAEAQAEQGKWVTGEYHTHTHQSDDAQGTLTSVLDAAFENNGLDWLATSDHLRLSSRDNDGNVLASPIPMSKAIALYQAPKIKELQEAGKYAGKTISTGFEWDMPTYDHASVGIMTDEPGSDEALKAINQFEYLFTNRDASLFDSADVTKWNAADSRAYTTSNDARKAFQWLADHYPNSYALINHPSRKNGTSAEIKVQDIRDINNIAPNIAFAFEGMPGNQMAPDRGETVDSYGGADIRIAKLGGMWDALLGEGRRFWSFANSDFHFNISADRKYSSGYRPGEYSKNYTWLEGEGMNAIVDGMRSGKSYSVNGDIINALDFRLSGNGDTKEMGEELQVSPGDDLLVTIRFKSPQKNNNGDPVKVDHIDLIAGEVTGKAQAGTPAYSKATNDTTKVLKRFTSSDWTVDAEGYYAMTYELPSVDVNQYFRLRGTNLGTDVAGETSSGEPLLDPKTTTADNETRFAEINKRNYSDMWFYSNPIFLDVPYTNSQAVEEALVHIELPLETSSDVMLPLQGKQGAVISWETSDASIAAIMSGKAKITRPALGEPDRKVTLTATATKGGESDSRAFELTIKSTIIDDMMLWYTFDAADASLLSVPDKSGNGHAGTLIGGAELTSEHGGLVKLDGTNDAVRLPDGILKGITDATITMNINVDPALVRPAWMFSFASSQAAVAGTKYLGLMEDGSGRFRASITSNWYSDEQTVSKGSALSRGVWKKVAYSISGNTATLYEDGVQIAQNTGLTLTPQSMEQTVANYIGRPAYTGDKYFNGKVSDFRIYARALAAEEVAAVAAEDDAGTVADDKSALSLGDTSAVIANLTLPASGTNGSTISWQSNNTSVVGVDGTVVRPTDAKTTVTLTATIKKGTKWDSKSFTIVVLATGDAGDVDLDKQDLSIGGKNVSSNLILPTLGANGSTISWQSSNLSVIKADGTVNRPAQATNEKVSLTATLTKGGATATKVFELIVLSQTPVIAHWKFSQDNVVKGTLASGDLQLGDLSGLGNDLALVTTGNSSSSEATDMLKWAEDGNSLVFNNYKNAPVGKYFKTVADAMVNKEKFMNGYTIEILFKMPEEFTPAKHQWSGILTRQGTGKEIGKTVGEPEVLTSLSVSNLQELQWGSYPTNMNNISTAWSFTLGSAKHWYHTAVVNDGHHTKIYIDGVTDFRNPAEEAIGIEAVNGKGWNVGASEYNGALDGLFAGTIQEIKITANALPQDKWVTQEFDIDGIIEGTNEDLPLLSNDDTYSIAFIPDTQNEVRYQPEIFHEQMQWLADQYGPNRIAMIASLGDIVDQSWVGQQWIEADKGFDKLDSAGAPYIITRGNHDVGGSGSYTYLNYFGDSRFAGKSYYHGGSPTGYSSYAIFEAGSYKYMVLSIDRELFKSDLKWAQNVLKENSTLPTIIISHESLIIAPNGKLAYSGNGQSLYDDLVKNNKQVFMTIGGHNHGTDHRIVKNGAGQDVIEMLVDYQSYYHGGNGWLRFMEMDEAQDKVTFRTYSPWVETLAENERTFFDLKHLLGKTENFTLDFDFDERFSFYNKVGAVTGIATDGSDPLAGALVSLSINGKLYSALTAFDGSFRMNDVPAGTGYVLTVSKAGYSSKYVDVSIVSNRTTNAGGADLTPLSSNFYNVQFDANGGETEANPLWIKVIEGGNVASLPAAPAKADYVFKGWNTQPDGSGQTFTATTEVNGALTVYAQWTNLLLRYDFDLNAAHGTIVSDKSGNGYDGTLIGGAELTTERGGSLKLDGIDDAVRLPDGILDGLVSTTISMNIYADQSLARPAWLFSFATAGSAVAGTKYMGLLEDNSGKLRASITPNWYVAEQTVSKATELEKGKWKSIAYTISGNTATLYEDGVQVAQNTNLTLTPQDIERTIANYIGRPTYSGDKYFKGQIADFRIYSQALAPEEIADLSAEQSAAYGSVSGMVIDASGPVSGAAVSLTVGDRSYETQTAADGSFIMGKLPEGTGYTLTASKAGYISGSADNVSVTADQITSGIAITLEKLITTYTVTFDKNGGSTEADPFSVTVVSGETVVNLPAEPARTNYTFAGWNTKADGSGAIFTVLTPVTSDMTVYAEWKQDEPEEPEVKTGTIAGTVTDGVIPVAGAKVSLTVSGSVYSAETNEAGMYSIVEVPEGTGYTLTASKAGYGSGSADNVSVTAGEVTSGIAITLNKVITIYTVTFDKNGGSIEADPSSVTVVSGETVVNLPAEPARTGYTFAGWNTKVDGSGAVFTALTTVTADMTVYAMWRINNEPGGNPSNPSNGTTPANPYIPNERITTEPARVLVNMTMGSTLVSNKQMSDLVASNKERDIVLSGQGYTFTFAKGAMASLQGSGDFDFGLRFNGGDTYSDMVKLAGNQAALAINYNFSGTLPGEVTIKLMVGSEFAGRTLYYYFYNETKKQLELVQNTVVDAQGFATVKQSHFSDYIFTIAPLGQVSTSKGSKIKVSTDVKGHSIHTIVPYYTVEGKTVLVPFSTKLGDTMHLIGDLAAAYLFKDNAKNFSDIGTHWALESIEFVTARELFSGTAAEVFSPNQAMTRGMLVTVLGKLWGVDSGNAPASRFTDVSVDAYYAPYVEWAAQNGIVSGVGNGKFAPNEIVTREQLAVMIAKFLNFGQLTISDEGAGSTDSAGFADESSISVWAKASVAELLNANLITGRTSGQFDPKGQASRAEIAVILKRLIERVVQ